MAAHDFRVSVVHCVLRFLAGLPASARCLGPEHLRALAAVQVTTECERSVPKRQLVEWHLWTVVTTLTDPARVRVDDVIEYARRMTVPADCPAHTLTSAKWRARAVARLLGATVG